jgi:ABC-type lipoprotein release transport system permease subunit
MLRIIVLIAWRNVWRNGRRSWVLIGAVAVGVFTFVGSTAFTDGFGNQMTRSATELQGGHIQIAASGYNDNPTLAAVLPADLDITVPGSMAPQVVASGMVNSTEQASGVVIHGVDPGKEPLVTVVAERIINGRYLKAEADPGSVVIGSGLAERLHVDLGEKVVLMVNDRSNEVSAGAYRIAGLFQSGSTQFDKSQVYLHIDEARRLFGLQNETTLITIRLNSVDESAAVAARLQQHLSGKEVEVLTWEDRNPLVRMVEDAYDYSVLLLAVILFTAVGFTLVNSFLMVIFERIREIGALLASGVRPALIRWMLMVEALFVALLGIGLGIVASVVFLGYLMVNGLDLSAFSDGLGRWGVQHIVYPVIDPRHMAIGFAIILVMVVLAVLYPAFRASRFDAVEAINHV